MTNDFIETSILLAVMRQEYGKADELLKSLSKGERLKLGTYLDRVYMLIENIDSDQDHGDFGA